MNAQPLSIRLEKERRLLAALYLWPRTVLLEPCCFVASMHGELFTGLQDPYTIATPIEGRMVALHDVVRRNGVIHAFGSVGGLVPYIRDQLVPLGVREREIPALVEQIRCCPRCGR